MCRRFSPIQDSRFYFNYHHTAADTLDKIVPKELAENAAVVAVAAYALANSELPLPRETKTRNGRPLIVGRLCQTPVNLNAVWHRRPTIPNRPSHEIGLFALPGQRHVSHAHSAFVFNKREFQTVRALRAEVVGAFPFATAWFHTAFTHEGDGIGFSRPFAPAIALAIAIKIDIEHAIGFDRPDRADGVDPGSNEDVRSGLFMRGTGACQSEDRASQNREPLSFHRPIF